MSQQKKNVFAGFTNQYTIAKTVRFELRPIGASREKIQELNLISQDEQLAQCYKQTKVLIDDYYRYVIDEVLQNLAYSSIDWLPLAEAITNYRKDGQSKDEKASKALEQEQGKMRKLIATAFSQNDLFKQTDKKELFTKLLPDFWETHPVTQQQRKAAESFIGFTTYFTGFHENRHNIFDAEKSDVSIPGRIVNDNFPRYFSNLEIFKIIQKKHPEILKKTEESLKDQLNGQSLESFFTIEFYKNCMSQSGIDTYNSIIGGTSRGAATVKTQGINEQINLWRQQNPNEKVSLMASLHKQILSDRESQSFSYEVFPSDQELLKALQSFQKQAKQDIADLITLFKQLPKSDLSRIYIPTKVLTSISQELFGSWSALTSLIAEEAQRRADEMKTKKDKQQQMKLTSAKYYSLEFLNELVRNAPQPEIETDASDTSPTPATGVQSLLAYWSGLKDAQKLISDAYKELSATVFTKEYTTIAPLRASSDDIEKIKNWLDAVQDFYHHVKAIIVPADLDRDLDFYNELDPLFNSLESVVHLYNIVRSTLTQKVNAAEKFKLNFENPTLANGWDENKEQDNTCIILRRDGCYYLGILNVRNKPKTKSLAAKSGEPFYEKMVYKLLPGPNKMLPKVFFSEKGKKTYNPPADILNGYKKGLHKKGDNFDLTFCRKLIDFFKEKIAVHPDWSKFGFKFSDTSTYADISGFYREVEKQGYRVTFRNVSVSQIDQWVAEGKMFLFQIYNKDYAPNSTGSKNLHTLYWEGLFSPENLRNVSLKLDGEAELFYRHQSPYINKKSIHRVGEKMVNKRLSDNETPVPDSVYVELLNFANKRLKTELSDEAKAWLNRVTIRDVTHEIIKDRRYTKEQFQIHFKMKINFNPTESQKLNFLAMRALINNPDENIIGLDRGERNLIYITIINQKGEIVYQESFNTIGEGRQRTNYHAKLQDKERQRDKSRRSWQSIGNIKDLKEGYLSQVVHRITDLMIEHNAIVVMEDLNYAFKQGRFHIEKQVYQKFEKALIDKLNYLVFKNYQPRQPGGTLNGYQLAPQVAQLKDIGRQCGFLFYVPADYTSKIDPTTGFVNLLRFDNSVKKSQCMYQKMDSIRYNSDEDYFEFAFDYQKMINQENPQSFPWTVCTYGDQRISGHKNQQGRWTYEYINVTQRLKELFDQYGINYKNGTNLIDSICVRTESKFFTAINWLLKLTLQMRYTSATTDEDYILSPVKNSHGEFFDSRHYKQTKKDEVSPLPQDADANGAYHIALKGLWLIQHGIHEENDKVLMDSIKRDIWFRYAIDRNNQE